MTEEEKKVLDSTVTLWNGFLKLEVYHPEDLEAVRSHIHAIQAIVMSREAVRNNPNLFRKIERHEQKKE